MSESPNGASAGRVAAFFDLDKTVIAKSSTLAFSRTFMQEGLMQLASNYMIRGRRA